MGTKRSILTDEKGIPLAVVPSGANTNDVKLLADTLDGVIISRPEPNEEAPQNLCLDAGYIGHQDEVEARGYIAHIRPRGEEKKELWNLRFNETQAVGCGIMEGRRERRGGTGNEAGNVHGYRI